MTTATIPYRGHILSATPPDPGINLGEAMRRYGLNNAALWKKVDAGMVAAGLGPTRPGGGGKRLVIFSVADLDRLENAEGFACGKKIQTEAPRDGEPVAKLAKDLKVSEPAIHLWCGWNPHPALGRQIRSGGTIGKRKGLLVSREDITSVVNARNNPTKIKFPGNHGWWLSAGTFMHDDGRLFFTERFVSDHRERFGFSDNALFNPTYRNRLEEMSVIWPGPGFETPWTATVFSADSIARLGRRRAGEEGGGRWLTPGVIWSEAGDLWYSTNVVTQAIRRRAEEEREGLPASLRSAKGARLYLGELRDDGVLARCKTVPLGNRNGGRSAVVWHAADAFPMMTKGAAVSPVDSTPAATQPTTHLVADGSLFATAADLAARLGVADAPTVKRVNEWLARKRSESPACARESEFRTAREARWLYLVALVMPGLREWLGGRKKR